MKSIEKNKKTLNVPLTGRLASIGVQKLPNVSSEADLSVRNPQQNPPSKRQLKLKKST